MGGDAGADGGAELQILLRRETMKRLPPTSRSPGSSCVECLIGKQKKPILFKVTEPSSVLYRAPSACTNRAALVLGTIFTLPALTVSDTAFEQVDADSVCYAINIASEAASAINAISKAKAFALNAASKAAFAKEFDYNTTSAATEAAAGACLYSRCVVPPRCTYLLYSTSLRMPICRIHNPIPYVSTPPSHALEKGIRGGNPSAVRSASCSGTSAQSSTVASPTSKRLKPITCPVCITAKARRANRPAPSTPADRPTEPWQDVYTDLSVKVRTASVTGAKYFAVFVDSFSGSKHIEFMNSKNHFIFGYKRFVSYLGRHPKTLRSDQGTEILNKELTAYLEANHTNHIMCSKDEHASIGAAENSIRPRRTCPSLICKWWCDFWRQLGMCCGLPHALFR